MTGCLGWDALHFAAPGLPGLRLSGSYAHLRANRPAITRAAPSIRDLMKNPGFSIHHTKLIAHPSGKGSSLPSEKKLFGMPDRISNISFRLS